jgi:hypothetical protein
MRVKSRGKLSIRAWNRQGEKRANLDYIAPVPRPALLAALLLALPAVGCAHTVVLDTEPHGAEVVVDGSVVGHTPVAFVEHAGLKRTYSVTLSKPGYQTRTLVLSQQIKVPNICCPLLILWAWELPEDGYTFPLTIDRGQGPPPPPGFLPPDPSQAPPLP